MTEFQKCHPYPLVRSRREYEAALIVAWCIVGSALFIAATILLPMVIP